MNACLRFAALVSFSLAVTGACSGNAPLQTGPAPSTGGAGAGAGAGTTSGAAGTTGAAGAQMTSGAAGNTGASGAAGASPMATCGPATTPSGQCAANAYKRNGVCACQDGSPCVCNGACTDPMTDDDNCGACGNRCGPTSTCQDGVCGAPPVTVLPAQTNCGTLDVAASNDDRVYFADHDNGVVGVLPLVGASSEFVSNVERPDRVAERNGIAYWRADKRSIRGSLLLGQPASAQTVVTITDADIGGFVVTPDGSTVYFSTGTDIMSVPVAGGVAVNVAHEARGGFPGALAFVADGKGIAFATFPNADIDVAWVMPGQVATCGAEDADGNLIQTTCARVARGQAALFLDAIFATPSAVIWIDGSNIKAAPPAPLPTVIDTLASSDLYAIAGAATTASHLYFAESDPSSPGSGVISRVRLDATNQAPVRLARGQNGPRSLAVSATRVFWSTADCTVQSTGL
jgi:hypothetical protein